MSTLEIRAELNQMLDQADAQLLKKVYSMVSKHIEVDRDAVIGYNTAGEALYASEALEKYESEISDVENHTILSDLKKEAAEW